MKYIVSLVGVLIVCLSFFFFKAETNEASIFCVNVVSNSNSENDEMIKFKVKEKISSFLNNESHNENLSNITSEKVSDILYMTNQILSLYHCDYVCDVKICEEKTPDLDFVNRNFLGKTCKTIYVKLGSGMGKESWQVFYE